MSVQIVDNRKTSSGLVDQYGNPLRSTQSSKRRFVNTGYSNGAASLDNPSLKTWNWQGGSPDDDITLNLPIIRQRSRDLVMNAPVVAGAINTITANVVGSGLMPIPQTDFELLGMDRAQQEEWRRRLLDEWNKFAESPDCDVSRRNNFYELTQLLSRSVDISGDAFVTMPMIQRKNVDYDLCLQLIEADCICNPTDGSIQQKAFEGASVLGGVEVGRYGNVIAYYVATRHPLTRSPVYSNTLRVDPMKWIRIPVEGSLTGRRNIIHVMRSERPGQRRGVPILAPVIETMKVLDRYIKAELQAALIQSLFTLIITTEHPNQTAGEMEAIESDYEGKPGEIALGAGTVQYANPGEDAKGITPTRPYTAFNEFVKFQLQMLASSLGIGYEMLLMTFESSYSASRAAMNMATLNFKMRRSAIVNNFCNPVWRAFMDEAVAKGYIDAPGYFDDPVKQRAYQKVIWQGPGYPMIDLVKEVDAAKKRVESGVSTWTAETAELTGKDFNANMQMLGEEIEKIRNTGLYDLQAKGGTDNAAAAEEDEPTTQTTQQRG